MTAWAVRLIRYLRAMGHSNQILALAFGTSSSNIWAICSHKTWAYLPDPFPLPKMQEPRTH
jgi:hypothetical protein